MLPPAMPILNGLVAMEMAIGCDHDWIKRLHLAWHWLVLEKLVEAMGGLGNRETPRFNAYGEKPSKRPWTRDLGNGEHKQALVRQYFNSLAIVCGINSICSSA